MRYLILSLLAAVALAQTPPNVSVEMDETASPELKTIVWFGDITGATQYNIYRESNPQGLNTSCRPSWLSFIAATTDNYYSDDPAPSLWQVPPTGKWRSQIWWCYAVSSVVNGKESPLSPPVAVAVADAFYVTLRYQSACSGNIQVVSPYPYPNNEVKAHFYYTDPSGVDHEFPVEHIYNNFNPSSPTEEWEGRLPVVANDRTIVYWLQGAKYHATIITPDGGHYDKQITAPYNSDAGYYSQRLIYRVQGGPDCPQQYGAAGEYDWWQNVLK